MASVPSAAIFTIKRHAQKPYFRISIKDKYGEPFDLTGAQSATFIMYGPDGVSKVQSSAVLVSPLTSGVIYYAWGAADTNTAGEFKAEFDVLYAGGEKLTLPVKGNLTVRVYPDLNNV